MNEALNISSSPHVRSERTTRSLMFTVILALIPASIVGVVSYGLHALLVLVLGVLTSVLTEFVYDKLTHKPNTWTDGSAAVTGLLLTLSLSPYVPWYIPVLGGVFAILVVKCAFGGLGKNFINPALAARCFLLISFGRAMTQFTVDGVSSATPIAELMAGREVDILQMFFGTSHGVIGSSVLALLVGGLFLWAVGVVQGEICFSVLLGFTVFMGLFGGHGFDPTFLAAHICGGGLVMGAFFMATDYVTSPVSPLGHVIYGLLIGVLGGLFRVKGGSADSFSYSIIIANLFVPLIDAFILPKPYAYRRSAVRIRSGDTRPWYRRIPKAVAALGIIAVAAGLALSGVFSLTKDAIEEQKRMAAAESYRAVLPAAVSFEADPALDEAVSSLGGAVYGTDFGRSTINEAMTAKDADGNTVGYAASVTSADGYDNNITLIVGVDTEGIVTGISFTELNETPGMGMRADEPEFKDQFAGRAVSRFTVNKKGSTGNTPDGIDAISGASYTSSAVVNAVNAGLDFLHANAQIGGSE